MAQMNCLEGSNNTTPARAAVYESYAHICNNKSGQSQTTPLPSDENIQQSFWEFQSDPNGLTRHHARDLNASTNTNVSLTNIMEEEEREVDDTRSLSSGEYDVPGVNFALPDESQVPIRNQCAEFPDHEADDALVDNIQETLELETNLPTLPFKFEEWSDDIHKIDDEPEMASEQTTFHPNLNKTSAFKSPKSCFDSITGLDQGFFLHMLNSMNEYSDRDQDRYGNFAGTKWVRFNLHELYVCVGIVLRGGITHCAGGGYESWFVGRHADIKAKKRKILQDLPQARL
jgi:hypothetical protein